MININFSELYTNAFASFAQLVIAFTLVIIMGTLLERRQKEQKEKKK